VRMLPVRKGRRRKRRRKRLIRPDRLISDRSSGEMKSDGQGPNRRIDDPVHQAAGCCYSNKLTASSVLRMSGQSGADAEMHSVWSARIGSNELPAGPCHFRPVQVGAEEKWRRRLLILLVTSHTNRLASLMADVQAAGKWATQSVLAD
jgi:hypothetical protein